ncbi:MAG: DUF975 family protein [Eubacteriales bacterium]|nr:DUF975 family protein [Eubacteriales bacterium]
MDIQNTKEIKAAALRRLKDAQQAKRVAAIYAGVTLGLSALVTIISLVLDMMMSGTAGLSGMGRRTVLSSIQTVLPVVSALITMCVELGYQAAMLRAARGQYVSPQSLRLGFDRFWVLLRCTLLEGLILFGIAFGGIYLATMIFMFTPFSYRAVELLTPVLENMTLLSQEMVLDEALYAQLMRAMVPAFVLCAIVVAAIAIPVLYRLRMARYVLIDKPGVGAMAALRESRKMMKGNCLKLLKLDVGLWWYYGAGLLAILLCYGDMLLPMAGVNFPWSDTVSYYLFFVLYLAAQFAVYYFLRNPAETSYAIAYDSIRPKEPRTDGVVLGNIFTN